MSVCETVIGLQSAQQVKLVLPASDVNVYDPGQLVPDGTNGYVELNVKSASSAHVNVKLEVIWLACPRGVGPALRLYTAPIVKPVNV